MNEKLEKWFTALALQIVPLKKSLVLCSQGIYSVGGKKIQCHWRLIPTCASDCFGKTMQVI
jgi:hypothetical protein